MSQKISQLPAVIAANISDTDIIPLVATNITSKVTVANLRTKLGTQPPLGGRTVTSAFTYLTNNARFNVKDFGATGDGVTDDTVGINLAITQLTAAGGGELFFPVGIYKTTSTIYIPRWTRVTGEGYHKPGGTLDGTSIIKGVHTGASVLSFKNALGCHVSNIAVYGDSGSTPKTGIALGRNSGLGSAGSHVFQNVNVYGYFTKAAFYMIASEENSFYDVNIYLIGGGALFGLFMAQGDFYSVDTFGSSSHLHNSFYNCRVVNDVVDDTAACIAIYGGAGSGDFRFFGGYLIPARGKYVYVNVGNQDGASMTKPISFYGLSGEQGTASTGPLYGYDLDATAALSMRVVIEGSVFSCRATGNFLRMNANLTLVDSRIKVPLPDRGSSYVATQFTRSDIDLGAGRYYSGDHLMNGTSRFAFSTDNTSGAFWGDPADTANSIQLRLQASISQMQLLKNGAFYDFAAKNFIVGGTTQIITGTGSPETVVTAPVGSLFLRTDSATSLYVKQTGAGNTGWVAK